MIDDTEVVALDNMQADASINAQENIQNNTPGNKCCILRFDHVLYLFGFITIIIGISCLTFASEKELDRYDVCQYYAKDDCLDNCKCGWCTLVFTDQSMCIQAYENNCDGYFDTIYEEGTSQEAMTCRREIRDLYITGGVMIGIGFIAVIVGFLLWTHEKHNFHIYQQ